MLIENFFEEVIKNFSYAGIFFILFLESLPFIGIILPGGLFFIFFVGILSRVGYLNPIISFIICFIASVSADLTGYFIGKKKGESIIKKSSEIFFIDKVFFNKIANISKNNPKKTSLLGKFNPFSRSIVPFIHGMKNLNKKYFIFLSLIGSFFCVGIFWGIGFILGKGIKTAKYINKMLFLYTLILMILIYSYIFLRKIIKNKNGFNK